MSRRTRDYYEVLGVPRNASQKDIKAAFRRLARQHHPDVNPDDPQATERFREISEAYEVLSDNEKRARYDGGGFAERRAQEARQAGGFEYTSVSPDDLEDLFGSRAPFSDFFNDLFGGTDTATAGRDVEVEVPISIEEAYRGGRRTLELESPEGRRTVEIRIPPGVRDGARLRVPGEGGRGLRGGAAGDLYARVRNSRTTGSGARAMMSTSAYRCRSTLRSWAAKFGFLLPVGERSH